MPHPRRTRRTHRERVRASSHKPQKNILASVIKYIYKIYYTNIETHRQQTRGHVDVRVKDHGPLHALVEEEKVQDAVPPGGAAWFGVTVVGVDGVVSLFDGLYIYVYIHTQISNRHLDVDGVFVLGRVSPFDGLYIHMYKYKYIYTINLKNKHPSTPTEGLPLPKDGQVRVRRLERFQLRAVCHRVLRVCCICVSV